MTRRQVRSLASIIILVIAAAYTWWDARREPTVTSQPPAQGEQQREGRIEVPAPKTSSAARDERSEDRLSLADVPEAEHSAIRATAELIDAGGPFPYRKDGTTFRNAERKLPAESNGYYREFTVRTPGSRDRGARRIVAGKNGEFFYTSDHYRSFVKIRDSLRN